MFKWLPTVNFHNLYNQFGTLSKSNQTTDMLNAKSGQKSFNRGETNSCKVRTSKIKKQF